MAIRKILLFLFAAAGIYLVARGGIMPILSAPDESVDYLTQPLKNAAPFDLVVGVMALLLLLWAFLLGDDERGMSRVQLLRALAVGSALLAGMVTAFTVMTPPSGETRHLIGILAVVAGLQALIGVGAALFLLCSSETRRSAPIPILMNIVAMAGAGLLFAGPMLS